MAFEDLRLELIKETREKIASSVSDERLIMQAASARDLLEQSANSLVKKAREWYSLTLPEMEHLISDHENFLEKSQESREDLLKEFSVKISMGANLEKIDLTTLNSYLTTVRAIYAQREELATYIEEKMKIVAPSITVLAGANIGAQLLLHAGSMHRLANVSSSTIQLYGAETALFRHLHNKKKHRSPKYGILFHHPLVQRVREKDRGKAARAIADKLSLSAKIDLFKGDAMGEKYKAALEKKFGVRW